MLAFMRLPDQPFWQTVRQLAWRVFRVFARLYWRLTRPVTLGVRGMVFDEQSRVLLVRHSYIAGWYLPGGGVARGETMREALIRELKEEAGVELLAPARFVSVFANFREHKSDHVGLFVIGAGSYRLAPKPNMEISELGFFGLGELPVDISPATKLRILEIVENRESPDSW